LPEKYWAIATENSHALAMVYDEVFVYESKIDFAGLFELKSILNHSGQ